MKTIEDKATKLLIEYTPELSALDLLREELQGRVIAIDHFTFKQAFSDMIELTEMGHTSTQFTNFIGDTWASTVLKFYPPVIQLSRHRGKLSLETIFVVSKLDFPE